MVSFFKELILVLLNICLEYISAHLDKAPHFAAFNPGLYYANVPLMGYEINGFKSIGRSLTVI